MEILRANLWEIKKSGSLKTMGGLLAMFHLLQFYLWWDAGNLPLKLSQQGLHMCWSLFDSCDWLSAIPYGLLSFVYWSYGFLVLIAALCFLLSELVALGYYALLLGTLFGL
jgi:hypothetical protein